MFRTNIIKPSASLVSYSLVDNVKHRFPTDIEDIDDNRVIKVDVVSQIELESTRRSTVLLAVLVVFHKVF